MHQRFFFGHHKCATNWIRRVIKDVCQKRQWNYKVIGGTNDSLVFPDSTVQFHMLVNSRVSDTQRMTKNALGFHLIRDPRDALVSGYWSWKISHLNNSEKMLDIREKLNVLDIEEGLLLMMDSLTTFQQLQKWNLGSYENILDIRYEDLFQDTKGGFSRIFDFLQIPIDDSELNHLVSAYSFESLAQRKPGEEDVTSHFRKGGSGDWQNYFTDRVKAAFKEKHGDLLINLNYANSNDW